MPHLPHFDYETPLLATGGTITAVWQFIEGHNLLGSMVTASVIALNCYKIYSLHKKNKRDNESDK